MGGSWGDYGFANNTLVCLCQSQLQWYSSIEENKWNVTNLELDHPPTHFASLINQPKAAQLYIYVFDSTTQWRKQAILTKTTTPNRNLTAMNMLHFKGLYKPCMFHLKLNCLTSQLNRLTNPFVMRPSTYMGGCRGRGGEGGFIPFPLPSSAESTLRKKGLSEEELCSWINDWAWEERIFTGY
jgi:hypothetical protein